MISKSFQGSFETHDPLDIESKIEVTVSAIPLCAGERTVQTISAWDLRRKYSSVRPPVSRGVFKKFYAFDDDETFEKRSFLFKFKERENFNRSNTLSILTIKI